MQSTIREVRDALDAYQLPRAVRAVEDFVQDDLSNWYVRRRRRELWKGEMTEGKALAYRTLFHVLVRVCQLLAPVMPFVADHIYRELMAGRDAGTPRSVHLTPFPDPDAELVDPGLEEGVAFVRRVLRVGLGVRSAAALKVRQPLAQMLVLAPPAMLLWLREFEANVLEELNIEAMDAAPTDAAVADTLRAHGRATWAPTGHAPVVLTSGDGPLRAATDGDVVVALDTRLTDALERKGFARQLVHQIQLLRKTAGLAVDDRIHLAIATDAHRLAASMSTAPTSVRRRWRSTSWSGSPRPAASSSMCAWTRGRQSSVSAGSIGRWRPCAEMETPAERWKATVSTSSRMWTRRPP